MKLVKIYPENPSEREIEKVVSVLKEGGLVIYPTDTVYGLGCDITQPKALEKIAKIKGVKLEKSNFSFVFSDLSHLSKYTKRIETSTFKILKRNLPGAYTFILESGGDLPKVFKNRKTIGVRIPNNNIALKIVEKLGNPIISTSIYDEDEILEYTTDPELIFQKWKNLVDVVIDGGYGGNVASTIVDLTQSPPVVLRQGLEEFEL